MALEGAGVVDLLDYAGAGVRPRGRALVVVLEGVGGAGDVHHEEGLAGDVDVEPGALLVGLVDVLGDPAGLAVTDEVVDHAGEVLVAAHADPGDQRRGIHPHRFAIL